MPQRIIVALAYALGVTVATLQGTGIPQTPEAWGGVAVAFAIAFWGKFSSNQTIIAPNRPAWTDEQRAKESMAELNKGLK